MRILRTLSTGLAALMLAGAAWAEIYETTDAQGNPEFTDSPPGPGAEEINLPQTNIIDAPVEQPQQVSAPQPSAQQAAPEQENRTVIIHDRNDDEDEVYDAYQRREQAFERMDPAAPHEVLDGEAPREVGDSNSQMPHEVGDFNTPSPEEIDGEVPVTHVEGAPVERHIVHPHKR
ncbi:MAG: DUF4124 domain-containing protein [Halioglobus sp.]|nr:DUF4124 domain-containing protein [Halioglobus sp.]